MAGEDRSDKVVTPTRSPGGERAEAEGNFATPDGFRKQDPRPRAARPDPRTGEVRAGPGDAGLQDRPEINAGGPGNAQMSKRRLGIGLGLAAALAILAFVFAAIFGVSP